MNKKFKFIFLVFFSIFSVLTTLFIIITYSGYKIDFRYFRLVKTGSIYINTNPIGADIYIDNEKISQKTPTIVNHINPGRYDIKLEKKGYKTWETNIEIVPEITTFLNYELIYQDIELNKANEFSKNNLVVSNNNKYIAYVKNENNVNNLFVYNIYTKDEFNIYQTDKEIKNIEWSSGDKKLLINIDNKFFVLDMTIIPLPVIERIESNKLLNINSIIDNIDLALWNRTDDNKILIKTLDNKIYVVDLLSDKLTKIKIEDFTGKTILLVDQKIIYVNKNNEIVEFDIQTDIVNKYTTLKGIDNITYEKNYIIFFDSQDNIFLYKKSLKSEPIKLSGKKIKINKTKIITFNDNEISIYNERENSLENTLRYGQKIIDLDFYNENYIVVILQDGIKLINTDGNINELDIISNLKTIEKVIVTDARINLIYKDFDKYMISNMDLK